MISAKIQNVCSTPRQATPARTTLSATGLTQRPVTRCSAQNQETWSAGQTLKQVMSAAAAAVILLSSVQPVHADARTEGAGAMSVTNKLLCDTECEANLASLETVTTASGLQYKDIIVGKGPNPPVGFQAVVNYVAITPSGRIFDSSLDKGVPYDIRVGANQVIPGLDEGLLSMRPGGLRRLFIPGPLSFPKGLKAAPGRPAVPSFSPMVFDVKLEYIPGMEVDEDDVLTFPE